MIGIDTVRVSRIKKAVESAAFVDRVFTADEQAYCNAQPRPEQSYAGLFCAKEAAVKAVKLGFSGGLMPIDIEIVHDESGAPELTAHGKAAEVFRPYAVDVSISHDGDYAVAAVMLTTRGR